MSVDVQQPSTVTMEDDQDDFQDAFEDLPPASPQDLESALEDARKSIQYFFNNQFDDARMTLKPLADCSLYHSLGTAVFAFLEAVLTFQQEHIKLASDALKNCVNVCDRHRRKNTVYETLGKMVKKPNYSTYTDMEIHAELCYAEALLLKSLLTFIEDETLVTFIKAGLKIRSCYNSYKECADILNSRNWGDDPNKVHFESGVRMGIGAFNLMISLLPAKIIKLLEFIGFGGSQSLGLSELHKGFELHTSLRQILCVMTLLAYHLIITYVLSHGDGDLELCRVILEEQLVKYPQGVWFLFFKGRLEFMLGNLDEAAEWYVRSWHSQNQWPHFHHLCFWELMFVHSLRLDWRSADQYAEMLTVQSRWSRTIYSYQRASILFMMRDDLSPVEQNKIEELMREAPRYKQRIAGKSLPMEKFVVKKTERFFAQKKFLVLPALELVYLWNLFRVVGKRWSLAERVYTLIQRTEKELENSRSASEFEADNKGLLLLMKGAILFYMGSPLQAEQCLQQVVDLEKHIRDDTYLVPYAFVEMATIAQSQGNSQRALQLVEHARKNYSGYSNESRLHFKMHAIVQDAGAKRNVVESSSDDVIEENGCHQTRL